MGLKTVGSLERFLSHDKIANMASYKTDRLFLSFRINSEGFNSGCERVYLTQAEINDSEQYRRQKKWKKKKAKREKKGKKKERKRNKRTRK